MPCLDPDGPSYEISELHEKLNTTTRLLCAVLETMERRGVAIPSGALEWWEDHKRKDAKRRAEEEDDAEMERTRKKILSRLTEKERRALGISNANS